MNMLHYHNHLLSIENMPIHTLAKQYGTPCYVYSEQALAHNWQAFERELKGMNHLICYAVKANSNLALLNYFARQQAGFDIVSLGELERVLAAKGDPRRIIFSGVGKREDEIIRALTLGIHCFDVESVAELERIRAIAKTHHKKARVALRINPNIDAKTHAYISTGLQDNKFGIDLSQVLPLARSMKNDPAIQLIGLACHIGSQLTTLDPFIKSIDCLISLAEALVAEHINIETLNIGGGLGIQYQSEQPPSITEYVKTIRDRFQGQPFQLILEPGRAMVGNTGVLITTVEYLKQNTHKNFAIVDAGMNDLIRPSLYDAYHPILPATQHDKTVPTLQYDIVGPVCESSDFLGLKRDLAIQTGDLLVIGNAGAYGFSMSSNYNSRPRAAEVLVRGDQSFLIREREAIGDLFAHEKLVN